MKKLALIGLLSVAMAGMGMMSAGATLPEDTILTDVIVSTGALSVVAGDVCNSTDKRIYGYDFTDSSAGNVGLYDASTTAQVGAGTGVFGEARVAAGEVSSPRLPYPRKLSNGLRVLFTNSTGAVVVYCR